VVVVYSSRAHRERHPHHLISQQRKTQQQQLFLAMRKRAKSSQKFTLFSACFEKSVSSLFCAKSFFGQSTDVNAKKRTMMIKSLFFSPLLCFLPLSSKKEGVCHFCKKDTFYGEENHR